MTIIIVSESAIISDRAMTVEEHSHEGDKSFERRGFCWALAGRNQSVPMLRAQTVDELIAAFTAEAATRQSDCLVIMYSDGLAEQFWTEIEKSGVVHVARAALETWSAVGCYRGEWARYKEAHKDVEMQLVAEEFVRIVHDLNGMELAVDITCCLPG